MANEKVADVSAYALASCRETAMGYEGGLNLVNTPSGDIRGVSLPKLTDQGYSFNLLIPPNLTMGTGLTLKLPLVDDGANAADLGKVVRIGVTVKKIGGSADTEDIDTGAGTEQTVDVTLDSTTGEVAIGSLAIASANLDSAAVGDLIAVRVRRVADHANDTCKGRAILIGVFVINT